VFKKYSDVIAACFFMLLGVVILALSSQLEIKDNYGGAALVPRICAVVIMLCAAKELYSGVRGLRSAATAEDDNEEKETPSDYKKVILTFVSIVLYALLFEKIGFLLATFLYIVSQAALLAPNGTKRNYALYVVVAVVFSVLIYFVFTRVFWIMLPTGIFR